MDILKAMFDFYCRVVREFNAGVIMIKNWLSFICIIELEYIVEYILGLVHTMTECIRQG